MRIAKAIFCAFCLTGVFAGSTAASADYIRKSDIEGFFCTGFVIEKCEFKNVHAVSEEEDSQLFEMASSFDRVDEFKSSSDRCHLYNNVSWTDPKFHAHTKNAEGGWQYLGIPESFTFKCTKK